MCRSALQSFGEDPNTRMLLGVIRCRAGDATGGIGDLERACSLLPTHEPALLNLAIACLDDGRLVRAREVLAHLLHLNPRHAHARAVLGSVLVEAGDGEAAREAFTSALQIKADLVDALAGLAHVEEQEHRLREARELAARALAASPLQPLASLVRARVALRQNDPATALRVAGELLHRGKPAPVNRAMAESCVAEACDAMSRFDEAFAAFGRANDVQYDLARAVGVVADGPLSPATLRRLAAWVARTEPAHWRMAPPADRQPVFLVGFPRSGTTLLEQVLASHPRITTIEECDCLMDAAHELMVADSDFASWADLPDRTVERLRIQYWARVDAALAGAPAQAVLVDKQPLNAAYLPLIHRLFPEARIILALRDPRDVVLSCFQQRFAMNTAMFQLLRLDSAAAYYAAVMALVDISRTRFPLAVHAIRYEDLIADFDRQIRDVLGFLGLEWNAAVRDFALTARNRRIGTPSAAQVVRPLHAGASGKWLRYRAHMEPVLPILEPWVRRFGYAPA